MRKITVLILCLLSAGNLGAKQVPEYLLKRVDAMINAGLASNHFPGASIAIGDRSGARYIKCYGYKDHTRKEKVTEQDVYDVASLTKVVSTTLAVMRLYDTGRFELYATVGSYLPVYAGTEVGRLNMVELLTHTSGLPYIPAYRMFVSNPTGEKLIHNKYDAAKYPLHVDKNAYRSRQAVLDPLHFSDRPLEGYFQISPTLYANPAVDTVIRRNVVESYNPELRGRYRYSDTNFMLLRMIVETITGLPMDGYVAELYEELEMTRTGYNPLDWSDIDNIIPTETDHLLLRGQLHGYVHDDLAALNGNVEGNAGIFSNASDLSNFCQMMLGEGMFNGKRILSPATVRRFTASPLRPKGIHRGLGFDKRGPDSSLYDGYGHTGYTGTLLWIDPEQDLFFVFLSNRVNPTRTNTGLITSQLRANIWEVLTGKKK